MQAGFLFSVSTMKNVSRKTYIIFGAIAAMLGFVIVFIVIPNLFGNKPLSFAVFTFANDSDSIKTLWKYYSSNDNNNYVIQSIRSHPSLWLFDTFPGERKIIVVQSLDNITKAIDIARKYQRVETIAYDFEHWDKTPQSERTDIPYTVSKGADMVHKAGFKFGIIPDFQYLLENYRKIDWSKVDFLGMQLQRFAQEPKEYFLTAKDISTFVKSKNPSTEIFTQLSFRFADADNINAITKEVKKTVDGFIISYRTNTDNISESCLSQCTPDDLDAVLANIRNLRK